MAEYSTYDFTESLARVDIDEKAIDDVVAAWGRNGDYSEWSGGFLVKLNDGRYAYLTGWCDTTGWGCQDGATVKYFDEKPDLKSLEDADWTDVVADLRAALLGDDRP